MNIEQDRWLYVYCHSAQRAREFFGLPPNAEVRLSEEQIEGALPQWAIKVPPQQPKPAAKPLWNDKGKIRLQCRFCGQEHDEIADFPPGWTDVKEIRSFGRATEPVCLEDGETLNRYGDNVHDWQTHFGICPDCREECRQEVKEAAISSAIQPLKELLDKLGDLPGVESVTIPPPPPPPVVKPNREELSNRQLAVVAKGLLMDNGGFTLDEFGNPAPGDLWAVSVADMKRKISGRPSIDELKAYLDCNPPGMAFFGGWYDKVENVTYLDHTLLFARKHTAIAEGLKNKQKAIYHLRTKETLELAKFSSNS